MQHDSEGNVIIRGPNDFKAYLDTRKNKRLYSKDKDGRVVVDHIATANVLVKFIELCPMDRWIKKVMIMRIGSPLLNQKPMSHIQIALTIGATIDEVIEMERAGKIIVGRYLERCSPQEAVSKFDRDSQLKSSINNINNILVNPETPAAKKEIDHGPNR